MEQDLIGKREKVWYRKSEKEQVEIGKVDGEKMWNE